ncbi:hypothetical protein ILUMI_08051 [Ignelater luminosus]|uniref:Uncharacterized protein n=1 Tax=Ignelater luminosus TaxID=2038154 RepID=A0A8K0D6V5_IGNLU|nr:hypothetical protein ILUMI_08051 [Ignelater luminosus]
MKYFTASFLFITIFFSYIATRDIPSHIKKCKLTTTEEVSKCILERIKELTPRLAKGIPELKIPPLDPSFVPRMEIDAEIGLHMVFTNISLRGLLNTHVLDIRFDFEKYIASTHFLIPFVQIDAICSIDIKAPILTLSNSGVAHANVSEIDAKGTRKFSTVKKNGKTYIKMEDEHDQDIKYGKATVRFEKLFGDDEELTQRINQVINENLDELSKPIVPIVQESVVTLMTGILQNFWDEYSLEEAFD